MATFRLAGAGKSTLKLAVSSLGYEYPSMPGVWANDDQVWALRFRGAVRQGVLAACALRRARGPSDSHIIPMICVWAAPPTCISRGLRAYQGVNAHIQRFACELHTRPGTVVSKTQPASAATPRCQCFYRGGLRFGHRTALNRDITTAQRGDLHH